MIRTKKFENLPQITSISPSGKIVVTENGVDKVISFEDFSNLPPATEVWDNSSTTFTASEVNVTDIQSAADSKLLDLKVNTVSKFVVRKDGNLGIGVTNPAARLDISDTVLAGSGSLAGSALNLAQTWNTTGNPTAIKLNVTNTASGAASNLLDLQVGGSSIFNVKKDGQILISNANSISSLAPNGYITINPNGSGKILLTSEYSALGIQMGGGFSILSASTGKIMVGSILYLNQNSYGTGANFVFSVKGEANLRLGESDVAAPVAQTLSVQSVVAGTTNTAGANLTINGSQGTGTGVGGSIIFQTSRAGISGTNVNDLITVASVKTFNTHSVLEASGFSTAGVFSGFAAVNVNLSDVRSLLTGFELAMNANGKIGFASAGNWNANSFTMDTILIRDGAANTLGLRNGVNPQTFRVYNTFPGTGNNEFGEITWDSNTLYFRPAASGTATIRNTIIGSSGSGTTIDASVITFRPGGAAKFGINSGGFFATNDNQVDIGFSNGSRPRNLFVASNICAEGKVGIGTNVPLAKLDIAETWNSNIAVTGASGTGSVATITFATQSAVIPVGSTIVVASVNPAGYNGTFVVTASSVTSVSYANATTTTYVSGGTVQQLFTAVKVNVTDTASNADSNLLDLQVGGSSKFKIDKTGRVRVTQQLNENYYISSFGDNSYNTGLSLWGNDVVGMISNGVGVISFKNSYGALIKSNLAICWGNANINGGADLFLYRDTSNILAQRNGVSPQTYRIYGTYTDASNYARLAISCDTSGNAILATEGLGTGAAGTLSINGVPVGLGKGNNSGNIAIGTGAMAARTDGGQAFAAGYAALLYATNINGTTAVGWAAGATIANGASNTSALNSTFIGHDTRAAGVAQSNQIVIGSQAIGLGSNSVVLGNDSILTTALKGNVGIGTTTPSSKLEVVGSIGKFDVSSEGYVASMTRSNSNLRFAGFNIGIINFSGTADGYTTQQIGAQINSLTEGSGGETWQIRPSANLLFHTTPNSSGAVLTERMRITGAGLVGIGTANPTSVLEIVGASGSTNLLNIKSVAQDIFSIVASGGSGSFALNQSNSPSLTINQSTGNKVVFQVGTNNLYASNASNVPMNLIVQGQGGNLGLGTSTPLAKLDIAETWNGSAIAVTGASGTGSIATITFATQSTIIPVGSTIVVASINPSGYNGTFIVTASSTTSVSYANTTTTTYVSWGTVQQIFTAVKVNVTDTNSPISSNLLDLQSNEVSRFAIKKGVLFFGSGVSTDYSIDMPNVKIGSLGGGHTAICGTNNGTGMFLNVNNLKGVWVTNSANGALVNIYNALLSLNNIGTTLLTSDGDDISAQRRTSNPQTFRLYNTFTDANTFERLNIKWDTNVLKIGTEKGASGGTARAMEFQTDGTSRWTISTAGHLLPSVGGIYDLGVEGSNELRGIWATGAVRANSFRGPQLYVQYGTGPGGLYWHGNSASTGWVAMVAKDIGVITISNYAQNDFDRLQFGGTTSSYPAIKRNGAGLNCRLADDSGDAIFTAGQLTSSGGNVYISDTRISRRAQGILMMEYSGTFDRLQFGGTTSSFPAIKRNGAAIQIRLADDSANAALETAGLTVVGSASVSGHFSATTKSFLIPHPTKPDKKLQYACLEGPENGVYIRGKTNEPIILLPDYWSELVDADSITVTVTPIGKPQQLFVVSQNSTSVEIGNVDGLYNYLIFAERKDVNKLQTEI